MNIIAPLSPNQIAYLCKVASSWLNVAEGGYRGGKNVMNTLAFCSALEIHPDRLHLIAGVSIATAKLNIVDCDGFGILNYFDGRCREGKFKNRDCLYVNTKIGEKIVLISGGGKRGDEKQIQGNTYGMVYITETNQCTPEFINMAISRTLTSSDRKIFMDLNPKNPKHWFYTDILAFHAKEQEKNKNYGYNYGHFTIVDNYSLTDEQIKNIIKTYDHNSVLYKRDIKGLRMAAEGLINQELADHMDDYIIKKQPNNIMRIVVGVDFGGNKSQHAFVATGFTYGMRKVVPLASKIVVAKDVNPKILADEFCQFIKNLYATYQIAMQVRCDSAEQTLINGLKYEAAKQQLPVEIRNAIKSPIIDRIRLVSSLISRKKIEFYKTQTRTLQDALATEMWDSDELEDVRLDDGSTDIDTVDAFEYTIEPDMKTLIAIN